MEDILDVNDIHDVMVLVGRRRRMRRIRPDFAVDLTEHEFHSNFRFSTDGFQFLLDRIGGHLQSQNNRGSPLTPQQKVTHNMSIYSKISEASGTLVSK